jgi:Tol biopolymer transport system component
MIAAASIENAFEISPDGRYVVYMADREIDGKSELYLADIGGNFVFLAYVQR